MKEVVMPAVGMAMTEGMLIRWLKQPGDVVMAGDVVAEIETDKATMDVESPVGGTLGRQLVAAGAIVPIGTTLTWILSGRETESTFTSAPGVPTTARPTAPADEDGPSMGSGPATRPRHELSPRARRLAEEAAHQAAAVAETSSLSSIPATAIQGAGAQQGPGFGKHRALIAAKVSESWHEIPHFGVTREIDADMLLSLRAASKLIIPKLTLTDLMLRALAMAFSRTTGRVRVNLGLAVATPDGVTIPIVSDVLGRSLADLVEARASAVERATSGRLTPQDIETAAQSTLSNLGNRRVDCFTGVIYPGQSSLLAIGQVKPRVVVEDGNPIVRTTFFATFNVDHRVYDGVDAARLLEVFANAVQDPAVADPRELDK